MPEPPAVTLKLIREREPGTPWELGDRLLITYTDEHTGENWMERFVCTGCEDGRIVEATSDDGLTQITFSEPDSCECCACHGEVVH